MAVNKHGDSVRQRIRDLGATGQASDAITAQLNREGFDISANAVRGLLRREGVSLGRVRNDFTPRPVNRTPVDPLDLGIEEIEKMYCNVQEDRSQFSIRNDRPKVTIEVDKPICLCWISDVHIGSPYCDYKKFASDFRAVLADERMYVMVGGDWRDNFQPSFKDASAPVNQLHPPQIQAISVDKLFDQLEGKIVAAVGGNHDRFMNKKTGMDMEYFIHRDRDFPYMPYGGIIELTIGQTMYEILWQHQARFNSAFNWFNAHHQLRKTKCQSADIVVLEHLHKAGIEMISDGGKHGVSKVLNIQTGAYKIHDP